KEGVVAQDGPAVALRVSVLDRIGGVGRPLAEAVDESGAEVADRVHAAIPVRGESQPLDPGERLLEGYQRAARRCRFREAGGGVPAADIDARFGTGDAIAREAVAHAGWGSRLAALQV